MKKLMIAAAGAAVAGGAFAAAPLVYDYKASVKYIDLKEIRLTTANNQRVTVYQKVQRSATLKGYLVQDHRGATSPIITAGYSFGATAANATPYAPLTGGVVALAQDQGRNRAFLVVRNSSATPATTRRPKILPAIIDVRWMDTRCDGTAVVTEGTIYVGGDLAGAYVRQRLDLVPATEAPNAATTLTATAKAGVPGFVADYGWTSEYLFGQYNGPQWSGLWDNAQAAIDAAQPVINTGKAVGDGMAFYHDTWMNHAGIGKARTTGDVDVCCGMVVDGRARGLESFTGNLKGGLFICSENGYGYNQAGVYASFEGGVWEDQLFTRAPVPQDSNGAPGPYTWYDAFVNPFTASTLDVDQGDIWQDGEVEQNTTDVLFGTFSIKRNTRIAVSNATTDTYKDDLDALCAADAATGYYLGTAGTVKRGDLIDLFGTLKAAALRLDPNCTFTARQENWEVAATADRFDLPVLTPSFASAYGLAHFTQY